MPIMDPDLFKYPYIYAVEVGQMELSDTEAARLREYLLRGGFWHCDDFWGMRQWNQFERQMKKIFPDREIVDIPPSHELFHIFYDINRNPSASQRGSRRNLHSIRRTNSHMGAA